jgi:FkbM family methyltransferase
MKCAAGVWLPDGETHMIEVMTGSKQVLVDGVATYQYLKLQRAMAFVKTSQRRRAIDIGAHVGTWAMHLARLFRDLECFEPVAAHRECFERNVPAREGVRLHPMALGERPGRVAMREVPWSTGSAHVWGEGEIEMRTLDSFGFADVDFIKIDVEGLELAVVRGAEQTIRANRPVMVVEQKGREMKTYGAKSRDLAVAWLETQLGMKRMGCISGDWIMGW